MHHPDRNESFYIQTDASNYALGAQLYHQLDENQEITVIAFTSRTFKGAELLHDGEGIGLVSCIV